jgi:hypothetical protein
MLGGHLLIYPLNDDKIIVYGTILPSQAAEIFPPLVIVLIIGLFPASGAALALES